ncbi:MAG: nitroreductase/quinone reductase family protein [Gammaproteobacteria bacterium]|nr:nitroreductase/quinone reductase family protein [Gammaproteobacteria bacterium]
MSRTTKIVAIMLGIHVLLVVAFESLLGYFQPEAPGTLVITTVDAEGETRDRVLSGLESDGKTYVAVNHWPRAWYGRVKENPNVKITRDGETEDHLAIPVSGEEHDRVAGDNPVGIGFRVITGFAPRYFVRLDPVESGEDR